MHRIATLHHNISHLYGPFLRLPVAGRWLTRLSKAYDLWLWRRSFAALQRLSLLDSWSWDWFLSDHACLSFIVADPSRTAVSALSISVFVASRGLLCTKSVSGQRCWRFPVSSLVLLLLRLRHKWENLLFRCFRLYFHTISYFLWASSLLRHIHIV